ncbi:MAG: hypothetical protein QHH26_02220 [Armatimonadota bacterium]|nr:hypothetical protein [Armatimonadota bacterium]
MNQEKEKHTTQLSAGKFAEKPGIGHQLPRRRCISPIGTPASVDIGDFSWAKPNYSVSDDIMRRIEAMESVRHDNEKVVVASLASPTVPQGGGQAESDFADKPISEHIFAGQQKCADILNCRIRVRVLKVQLADANPLTESMLRRKLKEAESQLEAILGASQSNSGYEALVVGDERNSQSTIGSAMPVSVR